MPFPDRYEKTEFQLDDGTGDAKGHLRRFVCQCGIT